MDNLISRQAVKEWLAKWEGYIDADIIARMQHRIIDIPSAQPESKWAPVSERLPEEDGLYLVTDHKGEIVRYVFSNNESSRDYWIRCAVAWMPLPEPYRAERRTDEVRAT